MADVNSVPFKQFHVVIGDGADPEVFTPRCTLNAERSFSITPAYTDIEIPDCDDADLPDAIFKKISSVTAEVGGNGVMEADDAEYISEWCLTGEERNVRVICGTASAGRQWSFKAVPGPFSPSAPKHGVVNAEWSLMSSGRITSGAVS